MAARYWVGGSGTWTASNTTNWAATSGGAGGQSVPGSGDTVTIDSNSGGTVTIQAGYNPTVSAVTLTANTLNINNNNLTAGTFSSSNTNTRTLAFGGSGSLTLTGNNATVMNTNNDTGLTITGSKNVYLTYSGSTGTRTISTCHPTSIYTNALNYFITAGSDTVSFVSGGGMTVNNIDYTGFSGTGTAAGYIAGNFTYSATASAPTAGEGTTMYLQPPSSNSVTINTSGVAFDLSVTINPQFGNSQFTFVHPLSCVTNTRVLTLAGGFIDVATYNVGISFGQVVLSGINFRGISWGGTSTFTITGNNATVLDISNMSNYNLYGIQPTVTLSYSGSTGTRTVLGVQSGISFNTIFGLQFSNNATDTVVVDGTWNSLSFANFAGTLSNSARTVYGNLTYASGVTLTPGSLATVVQPQYPYSTSVVTTNAQNITFPMTVSGVGTVQLADDYQSNSSVNGLVSVLAGTLDLNGANLDIWALNSNTMNSRTVYTNNGNINLWGTSGTVANVPYVAGWNNYDQTTLNIVGATAGSDSIAVSVDSNFYEGTAFNLNVNAGAGTVAVGGAFTNITFANSFTGTEVNSSQTIYGNLVLSNAMSVSADANAVTFSSYTSGRVQRLVTNGTDVVSSIVSNVPSGNLQFVGNVTTLSSNYINLAVGVLDMSNCTVNTGSFISSSYNTRTLVFGNVGKLNLTGNSSTVLAMGACAGFSFTGNASITATYAGATGTRVFDVGSESAPFGSSQLLPLTVTDAYDNLNLGGTYTNLSVANIGGTWTGAAVNLYGNLTLAKATGYTPTVASGSEFTFISSTQPQSVNTGAIDLNSSFTVNASNANVSLASNLVANSLSLVSGNLSLNNHIANANVFLSSEFTNRNLGFGSSGVLYITGNDQTVLDVSEAAAFTYTGTPNVIATYNGAVGTRVFNFGGSVAPSNPAANTLPFTIQYGHDTVSVIGTLNDLTVANMDGTWVSNDKSLYGNVTITSATPPAVTGFSSTYVNGADRNQYLNTGNFNLATSYDVSVSNANVILTSGMVADYLQFNEGNLSTGGYPVDINTFYSYGYNTRKLNLGNSAITVNGTGNIWAIAPTNMNLIANQSSITMTNTTANRTFTGGDGMTYGNINVTGGNTLSTSTTFQGNITLAGTLGGSTDARHYTLFTSGTTTTVNGWTLQGKSNSIMGLSSTSTTEHNLVLAGGLVSTRYLNISLSNAAPTVGNVWYAGAHSQNLGQNQGWTFDNYPPTTEGQFFFVW